MFPAERPAILNKVARGILGQTMVLNGGSLSNLLDEASIEKIAMSAWTKFWNKFTIFGNISAGFIGIYLIGRLIKLLLDTFVHGYALHTVYGWSVYLIGVIWDSLTQLLLHLGKDKPKNGKPSASDDPENRDTLTLTEMKTERTSPPHRRNNGSLELRN